MLKLSNREMIHIANMVRNDMVEVHARVEHESRILNEQSRKRALKKIKEKRTMDDLIDQTPAIVGQPWWSFEWDSEWRLGTTFELIATCSNEGGYVERLHIGPFIRRTLYKEKP